ncbi:MAG: sigma-70 family RNA polymerase sigma factor [Actinobacteria bacterium]|nr:sigma-70 family RNA polymerase sigma factor [Actinomycetota bacterium]
MDADKVVPQQNLAKRLEQPTTPWGVIYPSPESLYQAHRDHLVRTLTVIAGDEDMARESVQDAFVQLCLRWSKVASYDHQVAWLRKVSLNQLRNRRRSLARRAAVLLRLGGENRRTASGPESDRLDLAAGLTRLPERQRVAIVLHYVGDLSVDAVAQAMGVSPGTVKQHLHRGREALRPHLEVK